MFSGKIPTPKAPAPARANITEITRLPKCLLMKYALARTIPPNSMVDGLKNGAEGSPYTPRSLMKLAETL